MCVCVCLVFFFFFACWWQQISVWLRCFQWFVAWCSGWLETSLHLVLPLVLPCAAFGVDRHANDVTNSMTCFFCCHNCYQRVTSQYECCEFVLSTRGSVRLILIKYGHAISSEIWPMWIFELVSFKRSKLFPTIIFKSKKKKTKKQLMCQTCVCKFLTLSKYPERTKCVRVTHVCLPSPSVLRAVSCHPSWSRLSNSTHTKKNKKMMHIASIYKYRPGVILKTSPALMLTLWQSPK